MSKRVQPASEEKGGHSRAGWILVRSFDYRALHFRRPLNLECLSEIFLSNKLRAYRDFWGRETGLKAEQTPATLTPLIALTTQSLEGLLCIHAHACVCVCVLHEHRRHMDSSQGAPPPRSQGGDMVKDADEVALPSQNS